MAYYVPLLDPTRLLRSQVFSLSLGQLLSLFPLIIFLECRIRARNRDAKTVESEDLLRNLATYFA
jgi:hypothetical protein